MNEIEKLKEIYRGTMPSKKLLDSGWLELVGNLTRKQEVRRHLFLRIRYIALACIVVVFSLLSMIKVSEAATPGELLYPLRRVAEDIKVAVGGDKQAKVESRAQDVIKSVEKKNDQAVEKAAEEYKKTVAETQKDVVKNPQEEQKFKETLKRQEQEFKDVANNNPDARDHLNEIINSAKSSSEDGEVRGEKSNRKKSEDSHSREEKD